MRKRGRKIELIGKKRKEKIQKSYNPNTDTKNPKDLFSFLLGENIFFPVGVPMHHCDLITTEIFALLNGTYKGR